MMEDTQSVASLMDSSMSKIQQLQKAFAELESQRAITLNLKWKELEEHFHGLERSLKRRFHELEDQEKEYETRTRKAGELLEKKKADVDAKEKASLERLQKKRDAAMLAITSALEKYNNTPSVEPTGLTSLGESRVGKAAEDSPDGYIADGTVEDVQNSPEMGNFEVKAYPQLLKLCEDMDSVGLHKFVSDNRKNLAVLKEEIPFAFKAAANPASLVLDSLTGFYPVETKNSDGKKGSNLLGIRRTCIMLMECLSILLSGLDPTSLATVLSGDIKERAKTIADGWRPMLKTLDVEDSNGNSLEAHAFLQLLAAFGIASEFKEEELSKLVPMVSRRRQAAELFRSLGLSEKMPGVVEVLINSGRQIDAVNLAFAFELTEQFPPVALLKSYLAEARRASSQGKPGNASPTVEDEFNERELAALKAVIKCIEEHNMEEQYQVDPLQKRVIQLEKAKADKKRGIEPTKPQPKRPRASHGGQPRAAANPANGGVLDRYTHYVYENRAFLNTAPFMAPPPTYAFHNGNLYGNCYQYQPPPPPYFH
ncbi:PREDICTED: FRIGIDA-like protein 3 [Tarenaya hassleriana]|uniref:FRIGIDA-like protein 3 n=1 Tax=Tarenaya hassleriana TaxID=28532 RepID=UPI00053C1A22|nr:PREDICTED: FRIGIDA-like protein 3 [Tarenaya hassleriana]